MTRGDDPVGRVGAERSASGETEQPDRLADDGGRGAGHPRRGEAWRKAIHLSSVATAVLVWYLPGAWPLVILGGAVVCAGAIELARRPGGPLRDCFLALTGPMLRPHERDRISGATWLAIGYFLAVLLFPRPIATTSILYGGIGDPLAGIIGRRWGRPRRPGGKSLVGLVAGLIVNLTIGLAMPGIGIAAAVAGSLGASIAEYVPSPIDDNLRMTLGGGATLWIAMAAFGSG